jgi:DNA-directed RNA polymerase specialized sigma24 family protein
LVQPAIASEFLDPTLVSRAQRYERDAVASLCDRSLPTLHRVCFALTGEAAAAEQLAGETLLKALDGLSGFSGDGAAFHVWLLRLAATAAAKKRPQGAGTRAALAALSNFDYELITLRILGEVDVDHLTPALNAQAPSLRAWMVTALREVDGRSGTGWGPDLRGFDAAIDAVLDGADPEAAAAECSAPHDADRLLKQVANLRALIGEPIDPATATRLRTTLLAGVAEQRALWVYRHHNTATVPGIEHRRYPSRTGTFVALGIAAVLAVVVGAVLAVLSSFAEPTSAFYGLKRTGEMALLDIQVDPVDRANLEINLAETREREAEDMASRGNGDDTVAVLDDRYALLAAAGHDLLTASVHDAKWQAARQRLFDKSDTSMTSIERDLDAAGQSRSRQDVERLAANFDVSRKPVETELGRTTPAPTTNSTPPPSTPAP